MATAKKKSSRKKKAASKQRVSSKRTLIAPRGDKRYIRRDERGRIKESDDVSKSLSQDRRRTAKRTAGTGRVTRRLGLLFRLGTAAS